MVAKYVDDGMPKLARGKFDLAKCVQWRVAHVEEAASERIKSNSDKARINEINTEMKEIELATMKGEMIEADLVNQFMQELASLVATSLDAIGPRLSQDLTGIDDAFTIQETITVETRSVRQTIATFISEQSVSAYTEHSSGDHQAAA